MSKCIMLIRHAEKPCGEERGVSETGSADSAALSVRGWQRAGALVPYFAALAERLHPGSLARPQYILAARPTAEHPSKRPGDTVQGLADRLGIALDERWTTQDPMDKLARYLISLDGPVLVCWRHDSLPELAMAIATFDDVPQSWPAERFDLTWSLCCRQGRWLFQQVPQLLLAGDRLTPIDWPQSAQVRMAHQLARSP